MNSGPPFLLPNILTPLLSMAPQSPSLYNGVFFRVSRLDWVTDQWTYLYLLILISCALLTRIQTLNPFDCPCLPHLHWTDKSTAWIELLTSFKMNTNPSPPSHLTWASSRPRSGQSIQHCHRLRFLFSPSAEGPCYNPSEAIKQADH